MLRSLLDSTWKATVTRDREKDFEEPLVCLWLLCFLAIVYRACGSYRNM